MKIECPATRDEYVTTITEAWNSARDAVFRIGDWLLEAKERLPHGEYEDMIETDLPFGNSTAQKLKRIARCRHFKVAGVRERLPISWGTLAELEQLDQEVFLSKLEAGKITPRTTRAEVANLKRQLKAETQSTSASKFEDADNCDLGDLQSLIADGQQFGTIYADPPWDYIASQNNPVAPEYPTMKVADIKDLPIAKLAAKNAHLHLWVPSSELKHGLDVMQDWGFTYKTNYVWVKPNRAIRPGNYWANAHELMLLGVKGNTPFLEKNIQSYIRIDADEHSRKPDDVRDMIAKVSPGPRLELFARRVYEGWTPWGNEINRDDLAATVEPELEEVPLSEAA